MKIYFKAFLILTTLLSLAGCVNNSDDLSPVAAASTQYPSGDLSLTLSLNEVQAGKAVKGYANGGKGPYVFSMLVGTGVINAATGEFTPDLAFSGTATMQVKDAEGKSAVANFLVDAPLKLTPLSSIKYINEVSTITASGGKPPYTIAMITGAGVMTHLSPSIVQIALPAVQSSILVLAVDALGNKATADILVLDPLAVIMGGETIASIQDMSIAIKGGKLNASGDYTVTIQNGLGTLTRVDAHNYKFTPTANIKQAGVNAVQIQVSDDNGQSLTNSFEVYVAPTVSVGDMHSCALDNLSGTLKCWGENLRGQLGYGGDPNRQSYWGDEPSEQSLISENFKTVEFLSAAEKSAGDYIVDYAFGYDTTCAIVDLSGTRDIRCWGANSQGAGYAFSGAATTRFSYGGYRHTYLDYAGNCPTSSGSCAPLANDYTTATSRIGDAYRINAADPAIATGYWFATFFPRLQKTMPFENNNMQDSFGLGALDWGHPEYFNYYSFYDTAAGFKADRIYMWDDYEAGAYSLMTLLSTGHDTKYFSDIQGGSAYNKSSPIANRPLLPGGIKFKDLSVDWNPHRSCYVATDDYLYCDGPNGNTGLLGINEPDGNAGASLYGPVYPSKVFTAIGGAAGDADKVKSVAITQGAGAVICAIFDGNPVVGVSDDVVGCWGQNSNYGLGINDSSTSTVARYPSSFVKYFDSGTGTYPSLAGVKKLVADGTTGQVFCALKTDNTLWCWGSASYGKLPGYGTDQKYAVRITSNLAGESVLDVDAKRGGFCAITTPDAGVTKKLRCWGYSERQNYNIPKFSLAEYTNFSQSYVTGSIDPIQIKLSAHAGCLLPSNRQYLKCWGDNRKGMLGMGNGDRGTKPLDMGANLPTVNVGTGRSIMAVTLGAEHTCAILDNDYLKCWGSNQFGQLGLNLATGFDAFTHKGDNAGEMGDSLPLVNFTGDPSSKVKMVKSGPNHTCAVTQSENLYCWGDNSVGQLGLSSATRIFNKPTQVDITGLGVVTDLALGLEHTCALFDLAGVQSLRCWGSHESGQLGYGDINFVTGIAGHYGTAKRIGDQATDIAVKDLPAVDLGDFVGYKIKSISAGRLHTCVLFDNGKVRCFGSHLLGQIGVGSYDLNNDSINDNVGDDLFETGYKMFVDFGVNPLTGFPHKAIALTSGADFNCALLDGGKVKCWGNNNFGQLGIESTVSAGIANSQMGAALPYVNLEPGAEVLSLQSGMFHSCAVLNNAKVKCWGLNYAGQLGFGSDYSRGASTFTMGLSLPYVDLVWP